VVAEMKTRLSKILYDKGWTEMELSRRTGLAQSYINRVKNSRIVPTVRTALKICNALGVPVEEAFVFEEKPYGVTRKPYFPRHADDAALE
jgi:transcriptional regulator with XRE-family HTH domain